MHQMNETVAELLKKGKKRDEHSVTSVAGKNDVTTRDRTTQESDEFSPSLPF